MSKRPYYKRFPSDWLAGVMILSAEQRGVYDTIIDLLYDRGRPITDDPKELSRICGCSSPRHFRSVRDRLVELEKIVRVDGTITNARFERERQKSEESGDKVAEKSEESSLFGGLDLFENKHLDFLIPESRVHNPKIPSPKTAARESPITPDWRPSDVDGAYAVGKGFNSQQIIDLVESFVDHHLKKGTKWVDWSAAWRTWVRNEIKFSAQRQQQGNGNETNRTSSRAGLGFAGLAAHARAARSRAQG